MRKSGKKSNCNSKPGKSLKFANSMFQALLIKMSFTNIILIYFFVISTLSTQTLIRSQIDLGFHCFYLEITWKIRGILFHKRSGNPVISLLPYLVVIMPTWAFTCFLGVMPFCMLLCLSGALSAYVLPCLIGVMSTWKMHIGITMFRWCNTSLHVAMFNWCNECMCITMFDRCNAYMENAYWHYYVSLV